MRLWRAVGIINRDKLNALEYYKKKIEKIVKCKWTLYKVHTHGFEKAIITKKK